MMVPNQLLQIIFKAKIEWARHLFINLEKLGTQKLTLYIT